MWLGVEGGSKRGGGGEELETRVSFFFVTCVINKSVMKPIFCGMAASPSRVGG